MSDPDTLQGEESEVNDIMMTSYMHSIKSLIWYTSTSVQLLDQDTHTGPGLEGIRCTVKPAIIANLYTATQIQYKLPHEMRPPL